MKALKLAGLTVVIAVLYPVQFVVAVWRAARETWASR